MKLRIKTRSVGACCVAAVCALGATFAEERSASALGADIGAEAGAATRTGASWGPIVGGHLELRPIAGLRVGGYATLNYVDLENGRSSSDSTSYTSVGGRVRYLHTLAPKLSVLGTIGLGYVMAEHPGYRLAASSITNPTQTQTQLGQIEARSGSFLELPVGLGVAYTAFKHTNLSLNLTWRPGFSFKGDAYEGEGAYTKPTQGFSGTLGLSIFF